MPSVNKIGPQLHRLLATLTWWWSLHQKSGNSEPTKHFESAALQGYQPTLDSRPLYHVTFSKWRGRGRRLWRRSLFQIAGLEEGFATVAELPNSNSSALPYACSDKNSRPFVLLCSHMLVALHCNGICFSYLRSIKNTHLSVFFCSCRRLERGARVGCAAMQQQPHFARSLRRKRTPVRNLGLISKPKVRLIYWLY